MFFQILFILITGSIFINLPFQTVQISLFFPLLSVTAVAVLAKNYLPGKLTFMGSFNCTVVRFFLMDFPMCQTTCGI